ncbi:MAG: pantoate--beta-alanine ligase [Planctomycetota bacterium]
MITSSSWAQRETDTLGPVLFKDVDAMRDWVRHRQSAGQQIGLVPTMGALHEGHLSLVSNALGNTDACVVSIFVNPTQFGPNEDFEVYPRPLDADLKKLASAGVDAVFMPDRMVMYPDSFGTHIEPPLVASRLEGLHRPTHFRGVATIVLKLLQIIPADMTFLGQKDFQQCLVIEQMVRDLNVPTKIVRCPTVREADGLAMSSRNRYLDADQRQRASAIVRGLKAVSAAFEDGQHSVSELELILGARCAELDRVDYAVIVDVETLEPIDLIRQDAVAMVAAWLGSTRLIDNQILRFSR